MNEEVTHRAQKAASKKYINFYGIAVWGESIRSNPFPRKHPSHTIWHNAFYDKCRELGRNVK